MLLLVNVDDISSEVVPHVTEGLMARGAMSVHVLPSMTKKGRPEYVLLIDAPEACIESLGAFLAAEVGTIGLRILESRHICFDYRVRSMLLTTQAGGGGVEATIRVKEILNADAQVLAVKAEYEDVRAAVTQLHAAGVEVSFRTIKGLVEQAARGPGRSSYRDIHVTTTGGEHEEDFASTG